MPKTFAPELDLHHIHELMDSPAVRPALYLQPHPDRAGVFTLEAGPECFAPRRELIVIDVERLRDWLGLGEDPDDDTIIHFLPDLQADVERICQAENDV